MWWKKSEPLPPVDVVIDGYLGPGEMLEISFLHERKPRSMRIEAEGNVHLEIPGGSYRQLRAEVVRLTGLGKRSSADDALHGPLCD